MIDAQVIQDPERNLRVLLVQRDTPGADSERERIASALTELIAPPQRAEAVRVERIPLTPGGKLRTIVSPG